MATKHGLNRLYGAIAAGAFALGSAAAFADEPARGLTAAFEVEYLKFIADHHYSALRMTELAAGTDVNREAELLPGEGTSPTPNQQPVQAKAGSDELKSLARRNNRMQREEILTALGFLHEWYGIDYRPRVRNVNRAQIALLERSPAGTSFDHLFIEVFSRHHFIALPPTARCQVAADIDHTALHRYCSGILHSQLNDIQDMREMLCRNFSICDYQPIVGLKGQHSGGEGSAHADLQTDVVVP